MIKIHVWPEIAVVKSTLDFEDNLVISITSPGSEHPKIRGTNVHKFHFHDVREPLELMDGSIMMPMMESIAKEIVNLAIKSQHNRAWLIHCEAGISRSPGVAIGLASFIKTEPGVKELKRLYPCFNTHVEKLVREAIVVKLCKINRGIKLIEE